MNDTAETQVPAQRPATEKNLAPVHVGERGLILNDLDSMWRWSNYVIRSGLAPKGLNNPEAIFVVTQLGLEVGLTPMAAIQNIAPINGRPSIWGDAQLAIVRATGKLELFEEWFEQGGRRLPRNPSTYPDDTVAVCRVKRVGYPAAEVGFSVADAKLAGLWGKEGPWRQYPFRMLKSRARSYALRDLFGDALKGIMTTEEAGDLAQPIPATSSVVINDPPALPATAPAPAAEPRVKRTKPAAVVEVAPAPAPETPPAAAAATAVVSAPAPDPAEPEPTPQQKLADFVTGNCNSNFDLFKKAAVGSAWVEAREADLWTSFEDVSTTFAVRIMNAKRGLATALNLAASVNQ